MAALKIILMAIVISATFVGNSVDHEANLPEGLATQ